MRPGRKIYEKHEYKWVTKAVGSVYWFLKTTKQPRLLTEP
jgi:hypothetical protein